MGLQLRENEIVVKTLEQGWHAVVLAGWLTSRMGTHVILSNQRFVFLMKKAGREDEDIEYEIQLGDIAEATSTKRFLGDENRLRLKLKNGKTIHVKFVNLAQMALYSVGILGPPPLNIYYDMVERVIKEWANGINLQIRNGKKRQMPEEKTPPPPPPLVPCPTCGQPLTFIQEHKRWYCHHCKKYP